MPIAVIEGIGDAQRMRADLEAKGEGKEARCGSSGTQYSAVISRIVKAPLF
jgi:hypothetical protein